MKRSKNDHIRSTISRYFKRRQFTESEMPSRKDLSRNQPISELSVRRRVRSRSCVENTVAFSSISGDATSCDQQFTRLKQFVTQSNTVYSTELQPLLFPVFVHFFLEMLNNGHKVPAQKFHERHADTFKEEKHQLLNKVLKTLETKSDVMACREISEFRDNRFVINVTQESLEHLLTFLKAGDNMILLQVFNQFIKTDVMDCNGSICQHTVELEPQSEALEEVEQPAVPVEHRLSDPAGNPTERPDPAGDATGRPDPAGDAPERIQSLEAELATSITAVRDLPPCLPSICFFTFLNTYQGLCSATISHDKKKLSGSFEDSSISVWSLEPEHFRRSPTDCDVSRVTLAVDQRLFTDDELREKFNQSSNQNTETAKLKAHRGPVYKTRFLADSSTYLLSCSEDCTVRLWDMQTQSNVVIYKGHSSAVWDVNISSTDMHFASCSHDTTIKLWMLDRTYPLRSYIGHTMDVDCVEFHPNNNYLATGSADKTIRFWSLSDSRTVRLLQGHRGSVLALAFSPDGKLLASAGEDRRIRVWDLGTGQTVQDLRGHSDTVYSLAFNEQSSVLASGGADCCIRLWDIKKQVKSHQTESPTCPQLLAAFPTKSALISYLNFSSFNVLMAAGASS